jgi:hypothetical protein
VDQVDDPVGEVAGKVWAVIVAAVLAQAARHVNPGITLAQGELDIGIGLVVAQENVEARLLLLDQVVLKRQRLLIVVDNDVFNVHRLAQQASRFGIGLAHSLLKIRAHAGTQVFRFTYINHLAFGVFI